MIKDKITNLRYYIIDNERWNRAIETAMRLDADAKSGKVEVTEGVFYSVMEYSPKSRDRIIGERHERYADLQIILKGKEKFGVCAQEKAEDVGAYDSQSDFAACTGAFDWLSVSEGEFVAVFPWDIHAPSYNDGCARVKKAVIKIKLFD